MGNFFKAVGKAIVAVAKHTAILVLKGGALIWEVVTEPAMWVAETIFGGGRSNDLPQPPAPPMLTSEQVKALHMQQELQQAESLVERDPRAIIYKFVCQADRAERMKMDLSQLDPAVQSWCRCLSTAECRLLRAAGLDNVLDHVSGKRLVPGVGRVKPRFELTDELYSDPALSKRHDRDHDHDFQFEPKMAFGR